MKNLRLIALTSLLGVVCIGAPAFASEDAAVDSPVVEDGVTEHHYFLGAKGTFLRTVGTDHGVNLVGGGAFFEMALIPHLLELEVGARALFHDGLLAIPVDVLLKYPLHVSAMIAPYVGVGPSVVFAQVEHVEADAHSGEVHTSKEMDNEFGVAAAAGTYIWLSPVVGLIAELNYNLIFGSHDESHEVGGSIGVIYGF